MFLEETLIEVYPGYGRHARAIDTVASFCGLEVWQVADPLTQRIARRRKGAGHPVTPLAHRRIATGSAGNIGNMHLSVTKTPAASTSPTSSTHSRSYLLARAAGCHFPRKERNIKVVSRREIG